MDELVERKGDSRPFPSASPNFYRDKHVVAPLALPNFLGAYIEALVVGPDLGAEVWLHCNTVRGCEQSALSLWS